MGSSSWLVLKDKKQQHRVVIRKENAAVGQYALSVPAGNVQLEVFLGFGILTRREILGRGPITKLNYVS